MTLSMKSFFGILCSILYFLLVAAENFAVKMDSATFYRRKRWKVRVLGGDDGESCDYLMDGSYTGYSGSKLRRIVKAPPWTLKFDIFALNF